MDKYYSKMSLEELEAERQTLSNQMDEAIAKFKGEIHKITNVINHKMAHKKVAEMTEAEREAISSVLSK